MRGITGIHIVVGFIATLAVAAGPAPKTLAATAPPEAAKAPVERLTSELLDTMKQAEALGFQGRFEKLEPALKATFDFPFMARLAAGRHWRKLSPEQQATLTDHFARMSVATFAARFDGYSGQDWRVLKPQSGPRETVLVPTELASPNGRTVTISYLVRQGEDGWRAVDVYLKGTYSEMATKRSEYSSVLQREGFQALLDRIEDRIAALRAGDRG